MSYLTPQYLFAEHDIYEIAFFLLLPDILFTIAQGIPLSLSGVKQIMQRMDWGDASDFVSFGNVGASCIDDSTFYVLVSPQNVVGNTIMTPLLEMVRPFMHLPVLLRMLRGSIASSCLKLSQVHLAIH